MKTTHISFSSYGGAGKVASVLVDCLNELGTTSNLIALTDSNLLKNPFSNPRTSLAAGIDEFIMKKGTATSQLSLLRGRIASVLNQVRRESPDLLHLHWTPGMIPKKVIADISLEIPVIATLHDFWMVTGGCHFPGSCKSWQSGCSGCPIARSPFQSLVERGFPSDGLLQRVHFVAPSHHTANIIKTQLPAVKDISVVQNPVKYPNSLPGLTSSSESKGLTVGLIATNLSDPRKKIVEFLQAISSHGTKSQIGLNFALAGTNPPGTVGDNIYWYGEVQGRGVWEFLETVDLLVVPSSEETFGLVAAEAIGVGTPVWAVSDSAQAELIETFDGGRTFENISEMSKAVIDSGVPIHPSDQGVKSLRDWCDPKTVAKEYLMIYEQALGKYTA